MLLVTISHWVFSMPFFCLYVSTIKRNRRNIIKGELEHTVFFWAARCFLWGFLWCIAIIFFRREASPCTCKSFPCENIYIIKWKLSENNRMVSELKVWLQFWVPFYLTALLLRQHFSKIQKNEFEHSLQLLGHAHRKEHGEKPFFGVCSCLFFFQLTCREPFFFISNTCISSKPSAAQLSNVSPLYAA